MLKFARTNVFGSFIHYWNAAVVQHGSCLGQEARKMLCLIKIAVGIDWQNIFTLKMELYRQTQWVILIGALARYFNTNVKNY